MGKRKADGKELSTLMAAASRILNDEEDLSEWDDDEVFRGQRRDAAGRFNGQMTKVVPRQLLYEHHRRLTIEAQEKMAENALAVAGYWVECLTDPRRPDSTRMRAAENLANRIWGKPRERVDLRLDGPAPFEELLAGVVLRFGGALPAGEVIDAEVVEDDAIEPGDGIIWDE